MAQEGPSPRVIARIVLTAAATVGLLYLLWLVRDTLLLVFIAVFMAVALGPAVAFFHRRKIPQGLAILIVYVLIGASIFGIGMLIVPPIVDQVDALASDLPGYVDDLRDNEQFKEF